MDVAAIVKYFELNEHPFVTSPDPRVLVFFLSGQGSALQMRVYGAGPDRADLHVWGLLGAEKRPSSGGFKKN
jgi:hypothetical protein